MKWMKAAPAFRTKHQPRKLAHSAPSQSQHKIRVKNECRRLGLEVRLELGVLQVRVERPQVPGMM